MVAVEAQSLFFKGLDLHLTFYFLIKVYLEI